MVSLLYIILYCIQVFIPFAEFRNFGVPDSEPESEMWILCNLCLVVLFSVSANSQSDGKSFHSLEIFIKQIHIISAVL